MEEAAGGSLLAPINGNSWWLPLKQGKTAVFLCRGGAKKVKKRLGERGVDEVVVPAINGAGTGPAPGFFELSSSCA